MGFMLAQLMVKTAALFPSYRPSTMSMGASKAFGGHQRAVKQYFHFLKNLEVLFNSVGSPCPQVGRVGSGGASTQVFCSPLPHPTIPRMASAFK